ncbi:unnamed protein product [Hermetia illucens]|uniref:Larval cuticle protein LCP-30 n=1 Tax=Hermetia illucens TaxID=343691 RepID=A0A7R8YL41_HERIL|nr:larval cuticle protein LCP-30-like [Hermetia illucens]CAD7076723.1 unnamed protein product [Hermetia illucens]
MKFVLIGLAIIGVATAQFAKAPALLRLPTLKPFRATPVVYRPVYSQIRTEDGQYRHTDDGQYRHTNDGQYVPDDSGRYVHVDSGYGGGYGQYTGDNGKYIHQDNKYVHQEGPQGGSGPGYVHAGGFGSGSSKGVGAYAPQIKYGQGEGGWKIIRQNHENFPPYHYLYETENKILAEETGNYENYGSESQKLRAFGFYEYIGDDGQKYRVDYTADEGGFVPKGAHIAENVQKSAEYLAKTA